LQKIFLHVGVEKTGTTTLQLTMAINRRRLQQHGFAYPIAPGEFNHIGLTLYAADPEAVPDLRQTAGVLDGQAYDAFLRRYPAQLREELARSGCHTAILSSEHCSSRLRTVAEVAKLYHVIAPLARECRAIVYLRRQDELVASRYSTAVKSGATDEFHFPQELGSLDYLRLLNMWTKVFGQNNISVRIFEPQQMKHGDLISDFFETVGYMQHVDILRPEDQNRSLDVHTVEFLRRFNTRVPIFTMNRTNPDRGYIEQALTAITTRECLRPSAEAASPPGVGFVRRSWAFLELSHARAHTSLDQLDRPRYPRPQPAARPAWHLLLRRLRAARLARAGRGPFLRLSSR
jgi:hypothetical protein